MCAGTDVRDSIELNWGWAYVIVAHSNVIEGWIQCERMQAGIYCENAITLVNECVRDKWQGPYINNLITKKKRMKRWCVCVGTVLRMRRGLCEYFIVNYLDSVMWLRMFWDGSLCASCILQVLKFPLIRYVQYSNILNQKLARHFVLFKNQQFLCLNVEILN